MKQERIEKEKPERKRFLWRIFKHNNKNNDETLNKSQTLVIAINNFIGERYDQLDIKKDDILVVTNWKCSEKGWVYGYRRNNKKEKGIFPELFIKIYKDENIGNSLKFISY